MGHAKAQGREGATEEREIKWTNANSFTFPTVFTVFTGFLARVRASRPDSLRRHPHSPQHPQPGLGVFRDASADQFQRPAARPAKNSLVLALFRRSHPHSNTGPAVSRISRPRSLFPPFSDLLLSFDCSFFSSFPFSHSFISHLIAILPLSSPRLAFPSGGSSGHCQPSVLRLSSALCRFSAFAANSASTFTLFGVFFGVSTLHVGA